MNSLAIRLMSFLLYLIPAALVSGPFIPDLFLVIIIIIFCFISIKNKQWKYYRHPFLTIFLFWCLYIFLRSIFSIDIALSLESSLFYFRFGLFAIAIWYVIENNANFTKRFTLLFSITFFIVLMDGYLQYFTGKNIFGFSVFYQDASEIGVGVAHRLSGFFNEQLILGSYLSRLLPLVFALVILHYSDSKFIIILNMFLLIATDVLVFISGERSAFFYLLLTSLMIVIFVRKQRRLRLITFIFSIFIIVLISFSNEGVKNRMIDYTIEQINLKSIFLNTNNEEIKEMDNNKLIEDQISNEDEIKVDGFLSGQLTAKESGVISDKIVIFSWHHQRHYISAIKMFLDNPIFGIGPKLFRIRCEEEKFYIHYGCSTHPHNLYIQLLAETGLIGFIPVLFCFFYIVYKFFINIVNFKQKNIKSSYNYTSLNEDYRTCLFIALLIALWPLIPTGSVFNNWLGIVSFLPVGFLLQSQNKS